MSEYLFEYRYNGATYAMTVPAGSLDEAKGRVAVMGLARYCGKVEATIPAEFGWLAKLRVWWGNL